MTTKKVLALIPARGGSKGIKNKNITPICGKPLIEHSVAAALASSLVDRVVVSTDSQTIADTATRAGAEVPFMRPVELARDDTPALPVVFHAVEQLERTEYVPDVIVLLQPTSPLRTATHIDEALGLLLGSDADSVVSVVEVPHNFAPHSVMTLSGDLLTPYEPMDESGHLRQRKQIFHARNGAAIYACTRDCLINKQSLYGDRILGYEMKREDSVDIDEPFDLELCEWLMRRRQGSTT